MPFIADLHIHSPYSRATSKELTFENLYRWGVRKGVSLIGTGDCTHPAWMEAMAAKLRPDNAGLLRLCDEEALRREVAGIPHAPQAVRFLITGEISTIYKRAGQTRKVHHVVMLPDLDAARRFAARLERIGNIRSDGRPILGLDSRDLLETLLETSERAALIPAHIWTPWFSALGSKSGFDSIEECYRDLSGHIFAVETGLSSDPPMNWRVSSLDRYTLVSSSDAHSPGRIGREACVFNGDFGYDAVMQALRQGPAGGYGGTLEFFPEEGKYHADGHRTCKVRLTPEESNRLKGLCPACGGPLTLGVLHRVAKLADRSVGERPGHAAGFRSVLSLDSILGEILGCGPSGKKALAEYERLILALGPELSILLDLPLEEVRRAGSSLLAEAIRRIRAGAVRAQPGYDGEYGVISVFDKDEVASLRGEMRFIVASAPQAATRDHASTVKKNAPPHIIPHPVAVRPPPLDASYAFGAGLNAAQRQAVEAERGATLVVAGPGTGKTRTLTERVMHLIERRWVAPESILAITFSNRAAREMRERIDTALAKKKIRGRPEVTTFHRWGLRLLRENAQALGMRTPLTILDEEEAAAILRSVFDDPAKGGDAAEFWERRILAAADSADGAEATHEAIVRELGASLHEYQARKREIAALDFCDLLLLPLTLLEQDRGLLDACRRRWPQVLVDEYQDVNALQYRLLRLVAPAGSDLFAIGDPDQAIYGFRGADVRYFRRFCSDYPDARVITLNRSYRSTEAIVRASAAMLGPAALADKAALCSGIEGPRVLYAALPDENAEAEYVVKTIEELIGGTSHFAVDTGRAGSADQGFGDAGISFGDIAVLYRTHAAGDAAEAALGRCGIPVQRPARVRIAETAGFRAAWAALEYLRNPTTVRNARHLLASGLAGVSKKAAAALSERLAQGFDGSCDALAWLARKEDLRNDEAKTLAALNSALQPIHEAVSGKDPGRALARAARAAGVGVAEADAYPWPMLIAQAGACATVDEYLNLLTLDNDADYYDPRSEAVALMTLHAAKGLEWGVVFIVGCEEGLIPLAREDAGENEERRLLYVGMTRAKKRLFLTRAETRSRQGQRINPGPSPFLAEIPAALLEHRRPRVSQARRRIRPDGVQLGLFD